MLGGIFHLIVDAYPGVHRVNLGQRQRLDPGKLCDKALANPTLAAAMLEFYTAHFKLLRSGGAKQVPP